MSCLCIVGSSILLLWKIPLLIECSLQYIIEGKDLALKLDELSRERREGAPESSDEDGGPNVFRKVTIMSFKILPRRLELADIVFKVLAVVIRQRSPLNNLRVDGPESSLAAGLLKGFPG